MYRLSTVNKHDDDDDDDDDDEVRNKGSPIFLKIMYINKDN